jgi:hypothetical protein
LGALRSNSVDARANSGPGRGPRREEDFMSCRRGNRLAMLLMTGVLLGNLWDWGASWLNMVLDLGRPAAQTACDAGPMIDPDGKCLASQSLRVDADGPMIDPDGQPKPNAGPMIDPNG